MNAESSSIHVGPWWTVASDGGSYAALDGDRVAVAGAARIVVWQGKERVAVANARTPALGVPRFDGDRVLWGPGVLDLGSGRHEELAALVPELSPGSWEHGTVQAWSPDGARVLVAWSGGREKPPRVFLADGRTGATVATLWEGRDESAPRAAWVGRRAAVAGFPDPRVWSLDGAPVARIPVAGGTVARIDATRDETRLLVTSRDLTLVDAGSWAVLDRWTGPWADGAISADGRIAAGIDAVGHVRLARIVGDRFHPDRVIPVEPGAASVTLAEDSIAIVGSGQARVASLTLGAAAR